MKLLTPALVALACLPLSAVAEDERPSWEWTDAEIEAAVNKVRAGRDLNPDHWPGGARVAVLLSFDVDNETVWLRNNDTNVGGLSQGQYGARVALGRILALLDEHSISATFFGPAVSFSLNPGMIEAIQASGGGVVGSLDEALDRLAFGMLGDGAHRDLLDGYLWSVLPTELAASQAQGAAIHDAGHDFAALAARQMILSEMRQHRGTLDDLETLDQLHALAQEYGIVTPYSSMIVLVDNRQQFMLDNLSELEDRYSREQEAIGETTPSTTARLTGVPEPEEWLLLGLAAVLLAWYVLRPRFAMERS